jgi:hypothetical protein
VGLDNDIYTILNGSWVTATIAKPTAFHLNERNVVPITRNCFIQAQFEGSLEVKILDNTLDERIMPFTITGFEGSEDDCVKCIKVIKKLLHTNPPTSGIYHIDAFRIVETNQLKAYFLSGTQKKIIAEDEF